jgi:hypothetical protein
MTIGWKLAASFVIAVGTMLSATAIASATPSGRNLDALAGASYIYIATVRKDGNQSRAVPVWFIATDDRQILIDTNSNSWKAKRIRRGSPVLIWIGARNGPAFIGKAEFVTAHVVQDFMIEEIPKKYWLAWLGLFGPKREKFDSGAIVTIRISVTSDLPQGFQSQPGAPAPSTAQKAVSSR